LKFLDIWLYRQWFTPYDSDIEFGRYIAKTVRLKRESGKITLGEIKDIHEDLCQNLAGAVSNDLPSELVEILAKYFLPRQEEGFTSVEHTIAAFNTFYRLEPSFKAFLIVWDRTFGFEDGHFEADDIGKMPVHLICTNERLNNRGFFEKLVRDKTSILRNASFATFKSAIQFIMDLEKQQSHNRPAIRTLDHSVNIQEKAFQMGWNGWKHSRFPIDQPSSTWVNRSKFTKWTGAGALRHAHAVSIGIRFLKSTRRRVPLADCWWWWWDLTPPSSPGALDKSRRSPIFNLMVVACVVSFCFLAVAVLKVIS
jgi:hypothetical protein